MQRKILHHNLEKFIDYFRNIGRETETIFESC
uniref:Uncharacterized protein n=1 Tax=Lepeophtheirus salmonis TaxID=72036 RepID=A0A0K2TPJ7_LEPSM